MAFLELADPAVSPLENSRYYTIAGLVNAKVNGSSFKTGSYRQRISIITPKRTQFILEIWSTDENTIPIFSPDFEDMQLILVQGARFHGISNMNPERPTFVFRLSQFHATKNRFVWLSQAKDFWSEPVSVKDDDPFQSQHDVSQVVPQRSYFQTNDPNKFVSVISVVCILELFFS